MQLLLQYAMQFVGTPYKWGGSNILEGVDCSGLCQELLASAGIDPPGDQSAQTLYSHFEHNGMWGNYAAGALAFYGESATKITHVAFMIDPYRVIEAGGGGHLILTKEDAAAKGACVRIRPLRHRSDLVAIIKPNYAKIGAI